MPAQKTQSVLAKYGQRIKEAVLKAKDNPVDYGFGGRLPPGIRGGIAQLTVCEFKTVDQGKKNAGEVYYREAGVVISPESVDVMNKDGTFTTVPVRGLQTSQIVMVCDVKDADGKVIRTLQENVDDIVNRLKMLGGEDCIGPDGDLEATAAALQSTADPKSGLKPIYFRFSTSLGKPQLDTVGPNKGKPKIDPKTGKPYEPRVWENWNGTRGLENYTPPAPGSAVQDHTGQPHVNGQVVDETPIEGAASQQAADQTDVPIEDAASDPGAADQQVVDTQMQDDGSEPDLDALAELANNGDSAAQEMLKDIARPLGFDVDDPNDPPVDPFVLAGDWNEAVALIRSGGPAAQQEVAAEPTPEPVAPPAPTQVAKPAVAQTTAAKPAALTQAAAPAGPKKGDIVKYRLRGADGKPLKDPKTKIAAKPQDYEVASVDQKAQTVGLKDVTTQKFVLAADKKVLPVKWSDLEK